MLDYLVLCKIFFHIFWSIKISTLQQNYSSSGAHGRGNLTYHPNCLSNCHKQVHWVGADRLFVWQSHSSASFTTLRGTSVLCSGTTDVTDPMLQRHSLKTPYFEPVWETGRATRLFSHDMGLMSPPVTPSHLLGEMWQGWRGGYNTRGDYQCGS